MPFFVVAVILASGCTQTPDSTGADLGMIDCGSDRECFTQNLETCTPAKFSYDLGKEENLTIGFEVISEVRGPEGDNCVTYMKVIKADIPQEFTELYPEMKNLEGLDMTCRIPQSLLSDHEEALQTMSPTANYCEGSFIDMINSFTERT